MKPNDYKSDLIYFNPRFLEQAALVIEEII